MKKLVRFFAASLCLLIFADALTAQVPSKPGIIAAGKYEGLDELRKNLSKHYTTGKWTDLQAEFAKFVPVLKFGRHTYDPSKNFYIVVFLSSPEDGEPRLIRFPYGRQAPDPYINRIPGKNEIFEIVLGAQSDLILDSSYISIKVEDPRQAQILKAVKMLEPIFAISVKGVQGAPLPNYDVNFEIRSVSLPFDRAKITIKDAAALSDAAIGTAITTSAKKLSELLDYRNALQSKYGRLLVAEFRMAIAHLENNKPSTKIKEAASNAIRLSFNNFVSKYLSNVGKETRAKEVVIAQEIEKTYLDMIEKVGAKNAEGTFEYENTPWENWSFGLMSAFFIANSNSRERVKLTDAGYYAFEPPKNPLPSVILNIHPWKFDSKAADMSLAERFRLFIGAILTPDIGGCLGTGLAIMRGLSINAGVAYVGFRSYKDPQIVVVDGTSLIKPGNPADPFKSKWGFVPFWSISYSFQ